MGSWRFIIIQTLLVSIDFKSSGLCKTLGCLSFILLNLFFSTQAAYAAPIIMMSQNRQNERDRAQADYQTNIDAKLEIEALTSNSIEVDKLDKIIILLQQLDDIKE
jgi:uncharacterized membrane protein